MLLSAAALLWARKESRKRRSEGERSGEAW